MSKMKNFFKIYKHELFFLISGFILQVMFIFFLFVGGFDLLVIIGLMLSSGIVGFAITLITIRSKSIISIYSSFNGEMIWSLNDKQMYEYEIADTITTILLILVKIFANEIEEGKDFIDYIIRIMNTFENIDDYYDIDWINKKMILKRREEINSNE